MRGNSADERPAAERLESWRANIIGLIAKAMVAVGLPVSLWLGVDAARFGVPAARWMVGAFVVSSVAAALAPVRPRVRARWAILNFVLATWVTVPLAGAQSGVGSIIILVAVLSALVLGTMEGVAVLGVTVGGLLVWQVLAVLGSVPRPGPAISDAGLPLSALRSLLIAGGVACVALLATSYLIRQLTRTLFEAERLVVLQRAEIAAREEETRARRKAEAELVRAQKLEVLGRVAGGVAHDVNNNLTVALAGAELVEELGAHDPKLHQLGQSIREACENASVLTRQLLTLGRHELFRPEAIRVGSALPRLERLLRTTIGRHIALEVAIPPDLPPVYVDPHQLEQVVLNLAINARDALPRGGTIRITADHGGPPPDYRVATSDATAGDVVRLHVSDDGMGIEDEHLPMLFEYFFTTKGPERGTGLGLPMTRVFAESSGGRIGVRTALGRGSTFTLELPVAPAHLVPTPRPSKAPDRPAQILVAEDDARIRAGMVAALRDVGYEVLEAADGAEAVGRARSTPHLDLLCTDPRAPLFGGEQVVRRVLEVHPNARVLVFSAYVDQPELLELVRASHSAVLPKPFSPGELREAAARALAEPEANAAAAPESSIDA